MEDSSVKLAEEVKNGLSFDLALIDMTMPEMGGMALLEAIKTNSSPEKAAAGAAERCVIQARIEHTPKGGSSLHRRHPSQS